MRPIRLLPLALALAATPAVALLPDPLQSPMWEFVGGQIFGADVKVWFDPRDKVIFPAIAEKEGVLPVTVVSHYYPELERTLLPRVDRR